MPKKLMIAAAALAMLTVISAPALAELTTDCSDLYPGIMPTLCVVGEDGLIPLPDGTKAPYTVTGNLVVDQVHWRSWGVRRRRVCSRRGVRGPSALHVRS